MKSLSAIIASLAILCACVPHKEVVYFGDLTATEGNLDIPSPPQVVLKPGDVLEINITSTSKETNEYFRKEGSGTDRNYAPNTYQIAADGSVDFPLIGQVEVAGYSMVEAESLIKERLTEYLQNPSVNMRIMSFRISVIGEVGNPGLYVVPDGKVNILEAIAMAGDLTMFGRRDNVLLIRNEGSERKYFRINLNSAKALQSPEFYLRNNDVLYIEPSKGRTSGDDNLYRILPITISVLTFVVVIITLVQ